MKLRKAEDRDKKRDRRRHGMRVDGKSIALIVRAQEKRDEERRDDRQGTDQEAPD